MCVCLCVCVWPYYLIVLIRFRNVSAGCELKEQYQPWKMVDDGGLDVYQRGGNPSSGADPSR